MIERNTTILYGGTGGYVRLATTVETLTRNAVAAGPVGCSVRDNEDGTAHVSVVGMPDAVNTVMTALERSFR